MKAMTTAVIFIVSKTTIAITRDNTDIINGVISSVS